MNPFWVRFLSGLAKEILPPLWDAVTAGDHVKAARLAELGARRYAEHKAAKELLDRMAKARNQRGG